MSYKKISRCRFCWGSLKKVIKLGKIPPVNYFTSKKSSQKYPLELAVCSKCELIQLSSILDPKLLFKKYHYQTGASVTLIKDLKQLAKNCIKEFKLASDSKKVLDIGCNDGTFLKEFKQEGIKAVGIEPGKKVVELAQEKGVEVVKDFFDLRSSRKIRQKYGNFDLVTSLHNLANIVDINDFLAGVKFVVSKSGVFIIEVADASKMIKEARFDSIYHEHYNYLTFPVLKRILSFNGFKIFRLEKNLKQGGSIRIFARPAEEKKVKFPKIKLEKYYKYAKKVEQTKLKLKEVLTDLKGKRIVGFGAPAKAVVVVNLLGLKKKQIDFIVDSTPLKQGKFIPGTNIPVFSEDYLKNIDADYCLLLAWNYHEEILKKLKKMKKRLKVIIPFPKLKVFELVP